MSTKTWVVCSCGHLHQEDFKRNCRATCCHTADKKVEVEQCSHCNGKGTISEQWDEDRRAEEINCPECKGKGSVEIRFCYICDKNFKHESHHLHGKTRASDGTLVHKFVEKLSKS